MAPLYDAVTTRIFPGPERDRMAHKLNGKDDRLRRADVRALAGTVGIRAAHADAAIDALVADLDLGSDQLEVPATLTTAATNKDAEHLRELVRNRIAQFA